jgi:hypothetical protein
MKALVLAGVAALILSASGSDKAADDKPVQLAMMCFKAGEQVSGTNKICYYSCAGSTVAINIKSFAVCPVSVDR